MSKEKIDFKYHHIKHYKYQAQSKKTLITSILLTLFFALVELFGGIFSGSLALISDSFHMFSDVVALLFSIIAVFYSAKKPNKNFTYGFLRIEIISAFLNGLALMIISVGIVIEAVKRLFNPEHVDFFTMFTIAVIGLLVNIILMFVLMKSLKKENNLNVKSALWHFLGDTLNSVGVIIAAIILKLTNLVIFDIIISVIISVVIFAGGLKIAIKAKPPTITIAQNKLKRKMLAALPVFLDRRGPFGGIDFAIKLLLFLSILSNEYSHSYYYTIF